MDCAWSALPSRLVMVKLDCSRRPQLGSLVGAVASLAAEALGFLDDLTFSLTALESLLVTFDIDLGTIKVDLLDFPSLSFVCLFSFTGGLVLFLLVSLTFLTRGSRKSSLQDARSM